MRSSLHFRPSPAIVLSGLALFFALGGSAFALGERVLAPAKAQPRCAAGAVRGIAVVTGDPLKGIANLPGDFTADSRVFTRKFNCTGGGVQVRRSGPGQFEVRFPGNSVQSAVANALSGDGNGASVLTVSPGVFRVSIRGVGTDRNLLPPVDNVAFVVVAI